MHLTVVTGNVWNHDDTNPLLDLRLSYDGGTEGIGGFYIPIGAPAGTVIADFDYVHGYPFCAVPSGNTHIFGFPNGVYVGNTGERRGDAAGSGLVITYTNSGDCGPYWRWLWRCQNRAVSSLDSLGWPRESDPDPSSRRPGPNTTEYDKKEGGNQKGRLSRHGALQRPFDAG